MEKFWHFIIKLPFAICFTIFHNLSKMVLSLTIAIVDQHTVLEMLNSFRQSIFSPTHRIFSIINHPSLQNIDKEAKFNFPTHFDLSLRSRIWKLETMIGVVIDTFRTTTPAYISEFFR